MNRLLTGVSLLTLAVLIATPTTVTASPWTLPKDELVLDLSHDFQVATSEYLFDGTQQIFPLNGVFRSHNARFGARYGFSDRFEGAATFNVALVTYNANALIMNDFDEGTTSAEATDVIRDFSTARFGAGDVHLHARYNLRSGLIMVTTESTVKLPTGYETPEGTFRTTADGQTEIRGQATLGDGQTDLTQSILFGAYIPPTRTFVRLDTGLRYRFGAPGHQAVGALRAGQFLGDIFVFTAGVGGHYTITEGDVIGEAFVAIDPTLDARDYSPDNVRVFDMRLDSDAFRAELGLLVQLGDIEVVGGYSRTLWGRNTSVVNTFSLTALFALPDFTD